MRKNTNSARCRGFGYQCWNGRLGLKYYCMRCGKWFCLRCVYGGHACQLPEPESEPEGYISTSGRGEGYHNLITLLRGMIDRYGVYYHWGIDDPWMEGGFSFVTRATLSASASSAQIPGSGPVGYIPNEGRLLDDFVYPL